MPLLGYMLPCDMVGKLDNLLCFVVESSEVNVVIAKICPLGLIVHCWGHDNVERSCQV